MTAMSRQDILTPLIAAPGTTRKTRCGGFFLVWYRSFGYPVIGQPMYQKLDLLMFIVRLSFSY